MYSKNIILCIMVKISVHAGQRYNFMHSEDMISCIVNL